MSDPQTPPSVCDYGEGIIVERLDKLLSHVEGVRQGEDIEAIHQMRVWSRRSRAALDIFHACFPGKAFARLEREVKQVTRALGAARDLDVMIEGLTKRAEALPPKQRPGLESFIERLRRQRQKQQKPATKAVTRLELHAPVRRFLALADQASERREKANGGDAQAQSSGDPHG
jgi:CHAD domain-containing protein